MRTAAQFAAVLSFGVHVPWSQGLALANGHEQPRTAVRGAGDACPFFSHTGQTFEFRGTLTFAQVGLNFFMQKFCAYGQNLEKLIYFCNFLLASFNFCAAI